MDGLVGSHPIVVLGNYKIARNGETRKEGENGAKRGKKKTERIDFR